MSEIHIHPTVAVPVETALDLQERMASLQMANAEMAETIRELVMQQIAADGQASEAYAAQMKAVASGGALIAAAYEAAADLCDNECAGRYWGLAIRALTPADAAAAQARLIREAHAAGMLEAAGIAEKHTKAATNQLVAAQSEETLLIWGHTLDECKALNEAILAAAAAKVYGNE